MLARTRFRQTDGHIETGAHIGLIALATSDSLFCITLFPRAFVPSVDSLFKGGMNFKLFYQMYGTGFVTTFMLTSTWITVTLACLRYLTICHPFRSRRFNTVRCAKIAYPIVCFMCCILNCPMFLQYKAVSLPKSNLTLIDLGPLDISKPAGKSFMWIRLTIGVFIPAVTLLLCNCGLIRALRQSNRIRLSCFVQESAAQCSRKWITMTLIIIAMTFIVLVFPGELLDFFHHFVLNSSSETERFLCIRAITNCMQVLNFTFNFILYFFINIHFRKSLKELCHCRQSRNSMKKTGTKSSDKRQQGAISEIQRFIPLEMTFICFNRLTYHSYTK